MPRRAPRFAILVLAVLPAPSLASTITIDFESLLDSTILTNQYPGVTFSNTIALTAGISLNEFEFPPHSGFNVASDNAGAISIAFADPVSDVAGHVTYGQPLLLQAFNASNTLLGSIASAFSNNEALSGAPGSVPNEFLQLSFSGISYVTLTGDPLGGSFTLDDLEYTPEAGLPVAEPGTLWLTLLGGLTLVRLTKTAKGS